MPIDLRLAEQVDALILGNDCTLIIGGGEALPHLEMLDAPIGARYKRLNGDDWRKLTVGNQLSNWKLTNSSNGCCGLIPFVECNGLQNNISTIDGKIPFRNCNGILSLIALN